MAAWRAGVSADDVDMNVRNAVPEDKSVDVFHTLGVRQVLGGSAGVKSDGLGFVFGQAGPSFQARVWI